MPSYVDLKPGQRVSILRDGGSLASSYGSSIRHVTPETVRIDIPRRGAESLPLAPADDVLLMLEMHGRLYTFVSRVQRVENEPIEAVFIDRPQMVQQSERRQFFRLITNIRPRFAAVMDRDGEERFRLDVQVLDVSGGGLQLRSQRHVRVGDRIRLIFNLGEDPMEVDIQVLALSVIEADRGGSFRVNSRFVELPRGVQERVVRFVFQQQVQFLKKGLRA